MAECNNLATILMSEEECPYETDVCEYMLNS